MDEPTMFKMNITGALSLSMIPLIIIFLFMDMFDTVGTLIGVSEQAGFIKDNQLPRANRAFLSDALGTVAGASLGRYLDRKLGGEISWTITFMIIGIAVGIYNIWYFLLRKSRP